MVGTPRSRAYSKAARILLSSLGREITPQLSGVMPASRNFCPTAFRSAGALFRGRWESLIETYRSPTRWIPRIVFSTGNRRNVYDATPILRPRQGSLAEAPAEDGEAAEERRKGAAAAATVSWRKSRRVVLRFIAF